LFLKLYKCAFFESKRLLRSFEQAIKRKKQKIEMAVALIDNNSNTFQMC
jgi:hypothetical protein